MSKFKKTCFSCGSKEDKLYDNLCEKCFKEENPSLIDLKPIKVKYCNSCSQINFSNHMISRDEFEERLPSIVKKNLIIDDRYILNEIFIEDFNIKGSKVSFDVIIDTSLK